MRDAARTLPAPGASRWFSTESCVLISILLHFALLCVPFSAAAPAPVPGRIGLIIAAGGFGPEASSGGSADPAAALRQKPAAAPTPPPPEPIRKPKPAAKATVAPAVKKVAPQHVKPVPAPKPQPKPAPAVAAAPSAPVSVPRTDAVVDAPTEGAVGPASSAPANGGSSPGAGPGAAVADGGASGGGGGSPIESAFGAADGPAVIHWVRPVYPAQAKMERVGGLVVLRVTLDERGRPVAVEVAQRAGRGFDEAAVAAVKQSRFSPARQNGRAVACVALLPIRFHLKGL